MPAFTLCSFATCPWVQRAAIVLCEKNIPFEVQYIDRDRRPDWFLEMSPHAKVPLLIIDGREALFESNAIAEYLDETAEPRLHPADPVERARNRAWTDFVPSFARSISACSYADAKTFNEAVATLAPNFRLLDDELKRRGGPKPYFNGERLSMVDAAYAPFLQRYTFMERLQPLGALEPFPHLAAWREALLAADAVKRSTVPDIEARWRKTLTRSERFLARFAESAGAAAA